MIKTGSTTIMALDVGGRRIGVALADSQARLAQPFTTLENSPEIFETIKKLIKDQNADRVIVGWPRNLSGQATPQTKIVDNFVKELKKTVAIPVSLQDEAVTSAQAEAELKARGKSFNKGDIDALAATYILEDYFRELAELDHA